MSGISNAISDILYGKVLEDLKLSGRSGDVFYKLQAIKSAKERGITPIAKIFDISRVTLMNWIWSYESNGIDGLRIKAGRGRKPIINVDEEGIIKIWLEQDNTITIKKLRARIKQELEKEIGKSATHGLMKRLGFSYITPRPRHYKQDKQKQEEFKKKSARKTTGKP